MQPLARPELAADLLDLRDLVTAFRVEGERVRVVDGVSLRVKKGRALGVVGESGCGKSVTALSIMRLVGRPHGFIESGCAWFGGRDLFALSEREMRQVRGKEISMVFQEPMSALNPV